MKLVVLNGDMASWEFPLEGTEMTLGRRSDNDIVLPLDRRISRSHARLFQREGRWYIEDVGSANGTFLNDRRVHAPVEIRAGDRIRVGRTWLQVVPEPVSAQERAAAKVVSLVDQAAAEGENIVLQMAAGQAAREPADVETLRRRLLIITQVAEALGSTLELDELLGRIVDYVLEIVPADRGIILLCEPEGELVPKVVRQRRQAEGDKVVVSRHLVRRALDDAATILTEDAQTDHRFRDASSIHELRIRSAICAPLIHRGQPLGAIYLDTTSDTEIFGHDAVELLNTIAPQAAAAIANARLYTELRKAYEELQQAHEQMVQAEKLSTIGTLAASIAHDMGNITSPMTLLAQQLVRNGTLDEKGREILLRQVGRLNALLRRLMSFTRTARPDKRLTDANEVVQGVIDLIATEARHRKVDLRPELGQDLPHVMADPELLEQALLNLVVNAIEACKEGDVVAISTELDGEEVVIAVRDTGPGISPEQQVHLFQPFHTTKPGGTGLGLFSARRIVQEELGGTIELDSQVGRGTTVCIRLPVSVAQGGAADSDEPDGKDVVSGWQEI
ncbi:MAG: FHA domain-containing protein [Armatimonadetes bacterium]|nr:FHA domain-containing protein [Armatimonadota bacterium]